MSRVLPASPGQGTSRQPAIRRRPGTGGRAVVLAAVAVVVVLLVLRGWAARSSWFFQDDFYLGAQASRGLSADFLLQEYSGHVMPAGLFLVWAVTLLAPLEWGPPLAVMLLMQLAAGLVLVRTVLLLLGRRWVVLLPVTLLAATPLTLNSVLWWGSGLQALPHQLALVIAVDGHLRFVRTHRWRYAAQSLLGVAGGLAFYEKVLLVPALLVLLSLLPLAQERGWRRVVVPPGQRIYWGAHALLASSYLTVYLELTGGADGRSSPPADWWTVAAEALRTVTVALAGGPWRGTGDMPVAAHVAPPGGVVVVVGLAIAALVVWTVVRGGRRARDAWLVLAAYLAMDVGLLLVARGPLAPFLASDPRYYADAAPVAALALALALRAVLDRDHSLRTAAGPRRLPSLRPAAALVATLAVLAGSVVTTVQLGEMSARHNARDYVDGMRLALRADPNAAVADSPAAPVAIVDAFLGGEATVAQVLASLPEGERLGSPGRHLRVFDRRGQLVEGILLDRVFVEPGEDGDCGYRVIDGPRAVDFPGPPTSYAGHVKVSYITGSTRPGVIQVAGVRHPVVFERGAHEWWVPASGRLDVVVVEAAEAEHALCLIDVEAGTAWPPGE